MPKRPRPPRADSLEAEIRAFQANISLVEPPSPLPEHLKPLWNDLAVERAVAEWSTADRYQLVEPVETLHDRAQERRKFRREPKINRGPQGPVANPRGKVIDAMTAKIGRLMRALLLDARANGFKIDRVAHQRELERRVRARADPVGEYLASGGCPTALLLGGDEDVFRSILPGGGDDAVELIRQTMRERRGNGQRKPQ